MNERTYTDEIALDALAQTLRSDGYSDMELIAYVASIVRGTGRDVDSPLEDDDDES